MMTVKQVSELTGVSIRTLRYYDNIGLLSPTGHTEGGYRLYDDTALERLQQILLFRELEFPLKDIISIMERKDFDRRKALDQQIELLVIGFYRFEFQLAGILYAVFIEFVPIEYRLQNTLTLFVRLRTVDQRLEQ